HGVPALLDQPLGQGQEKPEVPARGGLAPPCDLLRQEGRELLEDLLILADVLRERFWLDGHDTFPLGRRHTRDRPSAHQGTGCRVSGTEVTVVDTGTTESEIRFRGRDRTEGSRRETGPRGKPRPRTGKGEPTTCWRSPGDHDG